MRTLEDGLQHVGGMPLDRPWLDAYVCGVKLDLDVQGKVHVEVSYREAGQLFICRSSVSCGAGFITGRYVDDRIGEKFGLRTEPACQALSSEDQ
jgi:hypothetical protein